MDPLSIQQCIDLIEAVCPIAAKASEAIIEVKADATANAKDDGSPVTKADRQAHKVICDALAQLQPCYPILSEEGTKQEHREIDQAPVYWAVDPLDGTKEFINGYPEYTVNIALIENNRPRLGVIMIPDTGVVFAGITAYEAWFQKPGEARTSLSVETVERDDKTLKAAASRSHLNDITLGFLDALNVEDTVQFGSSLKICAVAKGEADVYPRLAPTWYWDTAAGYAIALGAGCQMCAEDGKPLRYEPEREVLKQSGFVVYNPRVFSEYQIQRALDQVSNLQK